MFALPIATIIISMSQSLLTILNVAYREASQVLILLSIDALITLLLQFYTSVLFGVEKLDEEAKIPLRRLVKSKMFKILTLPYIQAAITLPAAFFILIQYANQQPVQAAVYVVVINMVAHTIAFLLTYMISRTSVRIVIPWRSIGKYVLSSMVTAAALYLLPRPTTLVVTFAIVAAGAAVYATLLLAIDRDARRLVRSILQEIVPVPNATGSSHEINQTTEE
jgi:hypothetical protein